MDQMISVSPNSGAVSDDCLNVTILASLVRTELVVIDTALPDWQTLLDGVRAPAEVVLIGRGDGLAQLAKALRGRTGIDAIHVMSHGFPGGFVLGSVMLDAASLDSQRESLLAIRRCLSDDADILLYSCHTASGRGGEFLAALADITGANVAGSYNLTGAAALGGDWELGYRSGSVVSRIPFTTALMADYPHTLTAPVYSSAAAYIGQNTFVLSFDSTLSQTFPPLPGSFAVQVNGTGVTVSSATAAGQNVTLTLSGSAFSAGDIIEFTYTDPTNSNDVNAVQGTDGTDAATFSSSYIVTGGPPLNDPSLSATGDTQTFSQGATQGVDLFSSAAADTNDTGQTISGFTLTVTNVADALEFISPSSGAGIALGNGTTGPFGSGSGSVSVSGTTATVTVTGLSYTAAAFAAMIDGLTYLDGNSTVTPGARVITLTSVTDSGGSNNVGTPTGTAATVTVLAISPPTLTATGETQSLPAHSTSGVDLFSSPTAASNDVGQVFTGIVFTVSGVLDTAETLTIGGTDVALAPGSAGLTGLGASGGSALAVVTVASGVATVTVTALSLTDAQMGTLIDGLAYKDTSSSTLAGTRTVTIASITDNGPSTTALSGISATVAVADTTAPAAPTRPTLDPASDGGVLGDDRTNVNTPIINGTAEAGSTVNVRDLYNNVTFVLLGTAVANGSGLWSFTPTSTLADGNNQITATATDASSNISAPSLPLNMVIDTVAPAVPPLPTMLASTDSGVLGDGITNHSRPTLTGTGEPNSLIVIHATVGNVQLGFGSAVVDGSGNWSFTPSSAVPDGTYLLTLFDADAAGNVSASSAVLSITIDTVAPAAPVITSPALTDDSTPVITGTAEAGSTVTVSVGGATYTTVATGGVWSIDLGSATPATGTLALNPNGANAVSATATDAASNVSTAGTQTLTIDTTSPAAPDITSPALTNDTTPVIGGTAEAGSTVTVTIGGATYTTVASEGGWSIDLGTATPVDGALVLDPNGATAVSATATDAAGNVSTAAAQTLTIDTTAPTAPAITSPALTDDTTPVITGTAEAGSTVTVTVAGATYTTVATGGVWSIDLGTATPAEGALALDPNGANAVTATATDAAGNVSTSAAQTLTIDTTAPAAPTGPALAVSTDSGIVGDGVTDVARPTLTGTGEPGSTIALTGTFNGTPISLGSTTVGEDGNWAFTPSLAVSDGFYVVTATATDPAGNASNPSAPLTLVVDTSAPAVPTGPALSVSTDSGIVSDGVTDVDRPTVTGTGEPGSTIALTGTFNGTPFDLGTTTVGEDGNWAFTPSLAVSDGVYVVTATATDPAGNASGPSAPLTLVVDTTAPAVPTGPALAVSTDSGIVGDGVTNVARPTLTGTGEPGSTIALTGTLNGAPFDLGTTTVGEDGNWAFTPSLAVSDGVYVVTATATDPAGNASGPSAPLTLVVDTTAPAVPTGPALAVSTDSGIVGDGVTNVARPTLTGTGEPGSTIALTGTLNGAPFDLGTTTVGEDGSWAFTPSLAVSDGVYAATATATDPAGNASDPSAPLTLVVDTTAPAAPVITSAAITNDTTPVLTGIAESGSTITVSVGGATYTTVATNGTWSIDLGTATPATGSLAVNTNGPNAVSVSAFDPAGNASTAATQTLTIDTTAPIAPAITSPGLTDASAPVLTGTAEAGDTVTVAIGGATYTTIATGGVWTVNLATATPTSGTLALNTNGTNTISAGALDPAGNASTPATQTLTIDTTAPIAPTITSPILTNTPVPVLTGTAEAGDTVTVAVGGATYTTIVTGGVWTVNLATATPTSGTLALNTNGINTVLASAFDPAGNASTAATQTLTIDTTAPIAPAITSPGLTDASAPVLTGTAEAGDTVTVAVAGATYTTIATGGVWTVNLATATPTSGTLALNTNGTNTISAGALDPAGNASTPATQTLTIDTTAPIAPTITSPILTNTPVPVLTGTAEAGDTVTVAVGGATYTTIATGGVWTVNLATATPTSGTLALNTNGINTVLASAFDPAGNASTPATQTLTIDTTAPIAPAITSPGLTDASAPVLTGTAEAGDTVTVAVAGATYTTIATGGVWTVNLATATPTSGTLALNTNGTNTISAGALDPAGNASTPATQTLTIDTTAPIAPTITSPILTNTPVPVLTGTAEAGDTVTVAVGGATYTTIATGGVWTVNLATATPTSGTLALNTNGTNTISVGALDPAGNASIPATQTLTIDTTAPIAPAITSPTLTNTPVPVLTGTAEAGDTVTVAIGGATYTTIATGGVWTVNLATAMPLSGTLAIDSNGANTVLAFGTDGAGNVSPPATQTLTIDTVAPAVPTLAQDTTVTEPAKPVIEGAAETGSTVRLYQNGTQVGAAIAAAGNWSFTYPTSLAAGTYVLNATATDAAGNVSAASAGLTVQVAADASYTILTPVPGSDTTKSSAYDSNGVLSTVQTTSNQGQVLTSVTNSAALINIYDTAGTLIGTITQPSTSALHQPIFATTPADLAASTGSGPVGSVVNLLNETNQFVSQGNDQITVHAGTANITATGPSTIVNNIAANLTFYGSSTGTASVYGGSGTVIAGGGGAGGTLIGGTAGHNVLAAGGGTTTIVGAGDGDLLFGSNTGVDTLVGGAGAQTLVGGAGTEMIVASAGDTAFGGAGQSTLFAGQAGGDTLVGGSGTSVLVADKGDTTMWGGTGHSTLWGGAGSDVMGGNADINSVTVMVGGTGNDVFIGSGGTSTAFAGTGNDTFWTGTGAMTIVAGPGQDTIMLGSGVVSVTGGSGPDLYGLISGQAGGTATIANFKVGVDQVAFYGYDVSTIQSQVSGGNTILTAADHSTVVLLGVTQLAPNSVT